MENFNFAFSTQIIFGKERHKEVGRYIEQSARVLILYGSDRVKDNGLLGEIEEQLLNNGIFFVEVGGIKPNPRLSKVNEIVQMSKMQKITFILAVGGGSVIDTAKTVALGIDNEDVWSFFSGRAQNPPVVRVRIGVILTIAAAGSETSSTTVITNDLSEIWEKRDYSFWSLRPIFAILNPELTYSVPWEELACGGVDMISHVLERYFTASMENDLTDRLCEATLNSMVSQLEKIKECTYDNRYDAYAELMWAATLAHSNFLSTGRISDWASHAIEHEVSGIYDIKHGTGLAIIMPAWMYYVHERHRDRFERFAQTVCGLDKADLQCAKKGIDQLKGFFQYLGQPTSFREIGITDMDCDMLASRIVARGEIGQLEKLGQEDVRRILESVQ